VIGMTPSITLFAGLTLLLAIAIVSYGLSLRRLAQARPFPRAAFVPILTPIHTWRVGARALSIGLGLSMALYALLWISAAMGGLS
jgi:hypothetical protein